MTRSAGLPVLIETGSKRAFASAIDWPGWSRGGQDEAGALDALLAYAPRYARVAAMAAQPFELPKNRSDLTVAERLKGGSSIDFGVPEAIIAADKRELDEAEYQCQVALLSACWQALEQVAVAAAGKPLRLGPRGGGRSLEAILSHVAGAQTGYAGRLLYKARIDESTPPAYQLAAAQQVALDALDTVMQNGLPESGPRGGKVWPPRYFIRRSAWHILDHVWEIEDRVIEKPGD